MGGFTPLIESLSGVTFPTEDPTYPCCWGFPSHYLKAMGKSEDYAKQIEHEAWNTVKTDPTFWLMLKPLPGTQEAIAKLKTLAHNNAIYFITTRPGINPKQQTEDWLHAMGFPGATVIVSREKGMVAAGVELDVMIEDYAPNLWDVRRMRGNKVGCYLVDAPYNREDRMPFMTVVRDVNEALVVAVPELVREERIAA